MGGRGPEYAVGLRGAVEPFQECAHLARDPPRLRALEVDPFPSHVSRDDLYRPGAPGSGPDPPEPAPPLGEEP